METRKDIKIAKVNCDSDPHVCHRNHVHSYPSIILFK
jgi:thioredoxin-like negative regulator of GroEL